MRKRALGTLGWMVGCALLPTPLFAQLTAPREAAQLEVGPLSVYPTVRLFDAGRDTNVFNESENPKEDNTFTLNAKLLAVLRMGGNELLLSSGSDYIWFQHYEEERSANAQYAMRFNLTANLFKPYVGFEHGRTSTRPTAEIDTRASRLERAAVAGFDFAMSERTSLTGSVRFDSSTYDEGETFEGVDLSDNLNRSGHLYSGGVRYALTPLTTMTVTGGYSQNVFPESHTRDSDVFDMLASFDFSPDAIIRGRLSAGFELFKPLDQSFSSYRGGVFDGLVNWTLFSSTGFEVQVHQGISYSYIETEPYYLNRSVRGAVTQPIFGPFELVGGAGWERLLYRWHQSSAPSIPVDDPVDTIASGHGGVAWSIMRGLRVAFTVEKTVRHSSKDPSLNYDRLRVMSSVVLGS